MDDVDNGDDRDAKRIKLEVIDDQESSLPVNGESTPKEGDDDSSRADDQDQSREASVTQTAEDEDEVIDCDQVQRPSWTKLQVTYNVLFLLGSRYHSKKKNQQ